MDRLGRFRSFAVALSVASSLATTPRLAGQPATSQPGILTGTVTLAGRGDGVPGVRIRVPSLNQESMTDGEGRYELSLPPGAHELRAEMVGCRTATWTVLVPSGSITYDLVLDGPAVTGEREPRAVVDPGTGASIIGSQLPYTVNRLERKDLDAAPGKTIADLIRSEFPGVRVVQGSGMPGERLSIVMRGPSSISGRQDPLLAIDGLVTGGGLDDLDPRDVESIQLLKGSAATAVYGARGEAGVIEIRTKRGAPETTARCFLRSRPAA